MWVGPEGGVFGLEKFLERPLQGRRSSCSFPDLRPASSQSRRNSSPVEKPEGRPELGFPLRRQEPKEDPSTECARLYSLSGDHPERSLLLSTQDLG